MQENTTIYLPGSNQQLNLTINNTELNDKNVLILGNGLTYAAEKFLKGGAANVFIIVEDNDLLLEMRLRLKNKENIKVRLMEFDNTSFQSDYFDLIYSHGSTSLLKRNKIIKELKRILKTDGLLSVGEVIKLQSDVPLYISNIWEASSIHPFIETEILEYYKNKGFEVLASKDLSYTLENFYISYLQMLNESMKFLQENEKSYYKKIINKISHESKVYLDQGGNKYMGYFFMLLGNK